MPKTAAQILGLKITRVSMTALPKKESRQEDEEKEDQEKGDIPSEELWDDLQELLASLCEEGEDERAS